MEFWIKLKVLWMLICTFRRATSKQSCQNFPQDYWQQTDCPCNLERRRIHTDVLWTVSNAFGESGNPCISELDIDTIHARYFVHSLIASSKCSKTKHFKSIVKTLYTKANKRISPECKKYANKLGLTVVQNCETSDKKFTARFSRCSGVSDMCQGCFCEEFPRDIWYTTGCPCALEHEHTRQSNLNNIYHLIFGLRPKVFGRTPAMTKQCGPSGIRALGYILLNYRLKRSRDCSTNLHFKQLIPMNERYATRYKLTPTCFQYTLNTSINATQRYKALYDASKTETEKGNGPVVSHDDDCSNKQDTKPRYACYAYVLEKSVNATRWYKTRYEELRKLKTSADFDSNGCPHMVAFLWLLQGVLMVQLFWKMI